MAAKPDWRTIAPQIIYHAYPASDLLPIEPPAEGESINAFKTRAEEAGDTLFLFLCREADDEVEPLEYLDRLERAIRDIEPVRDAFADLIANGAIHSSSFALPHK